MSDQTVRSYQNLIEHYRAKGDLDKAGIYEEKLREATGERPAEADLTEAVALFSRDAFAPLVERFGADTRGGISSAVSASLLRLGDYDAAQAYLDSLPPGPEVLLKRKTAGYLRAMPGVDLSDNPRVHLLILSYNRRDYVENALRQLAATDYGNYAVFIADNNSTDGSWDIVKNAADIFPEGVEVHVERLPTNIGRPVGHNWLLEKYDHSGADYIAIGDDDLLDVPPTWLEDMIRTMRLFPDAAVVGGKALNAGRPRMIHGGVRKIIGFGPSDISLTNGDDAVDYGQFDCIDRVDHVIGCLHLYRRDVLLKDVGIFDIRLSPCQFVDIDHHLRVRLKDYAVIYNGLIEFRHLRGMGQRSATDKGLQGNSYGNKIKILFKYEDAAIIGFLRDEARRYERWLLGQGDEGGYEAKPAL